MGINPDGWKRERYAAYYPNGYELEWVEDPKTHEGLNAAYDIHKSMTEEQYAEKLKPLTELESRDQALKR